MRHSLSTLSSITAFLFALAASPAAGQTNPELKAQPLSTDLFRCYSNGSGEVFHKFCVSRDGNIVRFESPSGGQHMGDEGYVLCYQPLDLRKPLNVAYDAGSFETGWGAASFSEPAGLNKLPLVITRTTTDGAIRMKQTFNWDKVEKDVTISMDVTSLSGRWSSVVLDRYFDGDLDSTAGGDIYDRSSGPNGLAAPVTSVAGRQANGLMLVGLTDFPVTSVVPFSGWNRGICKQPGVRTPTAAGDWVGRVSVGLQGAQAGGTENVKFIYRAY
ncbi:MAG: hypothetical protein KIT09_35620 [Bryobacteraceae bacterium]|nr:hypothetical protein [Bryobacteraceae bacterium]